METIEKILKAIDNRFGERHLQSSERNFLAKLKSEILFDLQKQNEVKNVTSNSCVNGQFTAAEMHEQYKKGLDDGYKMAKEIER